MWAENARSLGGRLPVSADFSDPFPFFITPLNVRRFASWAIPLLSAGWLRSHMLALLWISGVGSPLQVEFFAWPALIPMFPSSGSVKKQGAVSHSTFETKVMSLGAGARLEGLLSLSLAVGSGYRGIRSYSEIQQTKPNLAQNEVEILHKRNHDQRKLVRPSVLRKTTLKEVK